MHFFHMKNNGIKFILPTSKAHILLFAFLFFVSSCHHKKAVEDKITIKSVPSNKVTIVAEKLGVSEKEVRNKKLYSFISEWYGTPYKYGGCDKNGIDCSCFTGTLYKKVYGVTVGRNSSLIHYSSLRYYSFYKITADFTIYFFLLNQYF